MKIGLLLFATLPAFATQAISLISGQTGSASAPNAAPYASIQGWRVEMRIWNWSQTASYQGIAQHPQIAIRQVAGANTIGFQSNADAGGTACFADMTGRTDAIIRAQRDYANSRMTCEIWNINGSNYVLTTASFPTPSPENLTGNYTWGDTGTRLNLSYLRMFNTVVATSSLPPNPNIAGGNLLDYEFEGNGNDSSANGVNITFSGRPTYVTDPSYNPAAISSTPLATTSAGAAITLNAAGSYGLNGSPTLTYLWQQTKFTPMLNTAAGALAVPAISAVWSDTSAAAATVMLPLAGTYYLLLTVCDSSRQCSQQTFKIGVVATDSNNIVIVPDPGMSFLLGPLTMWGTSPWPWYDSVMKADADAMFGPGGIPSGPPFGPTLSGNPGTVSVTNGSATITGTGTNFQTDFACNGTDYIAISYPLQNGRTGQHYYLISSCASNTSLTISRNYVESGNQSGLSYQAVIASQYGGWLSSATNWNYYDVVLALYRLYYRTGIDTYLGYARQLAAAWYVFPLDGGRSYNSGDQPQGARSAGILGMMAAALDNHPDWWLDSPGAGTSGAVSGIKGMVDALYQGYVTAFFSAPYDSQDFVDARETGYGIWFVAAYYYLHDPSYYAQLQAAVLGPNSIASRYHAQFGFTSNADPLAATGGYSGYGYSGADYQGSFWLSAFLMKALAAFIQVSPDAADQAAALELLQNGYDTWFSAHYMGGSCQEITYSSFYVSCDSGNAVSNCVNGCPAGTVTAANGDMSIVGQGTNFDTPAIFKNDGSDYIGVATVFAGNADYVWLNVPAGGIQDATHLNAATPFTGNTGSGLTIGRAVACPNGLGQVNFPQNTFSTLDNNIGACDSPPHYGMGGRAVAELIHQLNGFLYNQTGLPMYLTQGDALFAAAYGCGTAAQGCLSGGTGLGNNITGGGPGADNGAGNFADLLIYPIDSNFARGKEFGSNAGAGLADTYLAYRLGGPQPPDNQTMQIDFDLATLPGATQARVTLIQPSGAIKQTVCSSAPCSITVDRRQGNHFVEVDYLSAGGQVLSTGQPHMLTVAR